jgi:hypothetical protein
MCMKTDMTRMPQVSKWNPILGNLSLEYHRKYTRSYADRTSLLVLQPQHSQTGEPGL